MNLITIYIEEVVQGHGRVVPKVFFDECFDDHKNGGVF